MTKKHGKAETITNESSDLKETKTKKERKIKFAFLLAKLEKKIALKENQETFSKKIQTNLITFCIGPAGTAKTFTACYTLLKLLFQDKIQKIIFTKPIKEAGENLGFLPGDIESKLQPYMESFIYTCQEMIGEEAVAFLIENKFIENRPLAFMRGSTFNNAGMFLDEAQNCLYLQLAVYITRIGEGSKMIVAGDITQRDILLKDIYLLEFIDFLKGIDGVTTHEFKREDIVRNKILIEITDKYEEWKIKKGL